MRITSNPPLSPPGDSAAGQLIARGAKMATEDVNARGGVLGGRKIELIVEDDSGTPEKGAAGTSEGPWAGRELRPFRERAGEHEGRSSAWAAEAKTISDRGYADGKS